MNPEMISIAEGSTIPLEFGGPLTNHLAVKQTGIFLRIDYRLAGAADETYINLQPRNDIGQTPAFTLSHNGKPLISHAFSYG